MSIKACSQEVVLMNDELSDALGANLHHVKAPAVLCHRGSRTWSHAANASAEAWHPCK
eukprot:CAMPEP_0195042714 /NCGR_PEP_ID=MMETSP0347-20130606/3062_1 /TAXON_ID=2932 /ORGANISM="Alexandrium fundyense, Strain CCMP1719" /LENGTH=57 /DNA_ID=CAMNT_0040069985 /DNA_START=1 /DNA_END=171 /DNA_ORIENTATION=-